MENSPIYTADLVSRLYASSQLVKTLLRLEEIRLIEDESAALSKLVNTGLSRSESLSRWVRYREGYSPTIVKTLLDKFPVDIEGGYVLDPMCGSGSTQVAAQQIGLASAGSDVSPYAVLVSQVKTTQLSKSEIGLVETYLTSLNRTHELKVTNLSQTELHLQAFFPEKNLLDLVSLKREIQMEFTRAPKAANFLKVALLAIVEACSNRVKDGNGLASRPSKVEDVYLSFKTQVREMLDDLATAEWMSTNSVAFEQSAMNIDLSIERANKTLGKKLGAVIFSPPYANSFDYYESYKLELLFGDFFTVNSISSERKQLIRSYRQMGKTERVSGLDTVEILIDEIMSKLPEKERVTGKRDGRSRLLPNMLRGYFQDMDEFLLKAARSMPKGSYMAIIVDQSAYLGVPVPTDLLLAELGVKNGFSFERLVICRRAKTSGQQSNVQPLLKELLRESAVILRR